MLCENCKNIIAGVLVGNRICTNENIVNLDSCLRQFRFPVPFELYKFIDGCILFEMRGASGGVTTDIVACLVTPCTNMDGGEFKHLMHFGYFDKDRTIEEVKDIISKVIEKAENCTVKQH